MLMFDILLGVTSIYYCWLDLFNIYYVGDEYCNIPLQSPSDSYNYSESSLIFTLLSFILIHFIFIWLEAFRFVEMIVFQHNKQRMKRKKSNKIHINNERSGSNQNKHKKQKNAKKKKKKLSNQRQNYHSVNMDDFSKSMDDNKLMDIVLPFDEQQQNANDNNINNDINNNINNEISIKYEIDNEQDQKPINNRVPSFDVNEWIEGLFIYGIDNDNINNNEEEQDDIGGGGGIANIQNLDDNNNNNNNLDIKEEENHTTALSQLWSVTTGIVTTGFILSLTSDDFCCVCWDEFEIGQKLAKLKCGHVIHKQCAIEWFEQSEVPTCPTCRTKVTPMMEK